jgi:soluble lytic murein transglycosylase
MRTLFSRGVAALLCLSMLGMPLQAEGSPLAAASAQAGDSSAASSAPAKKAKKAKKTTKSAAKKSAQPSAKKKPSKAVRSARTARIHQAFVASSELRPMAQQLATMRSPAAYAGVTTYAHTHSGDAAAAAYLALGHAYLLDKRYAEAAANLRQASKASEVLADYYDFLAAEAEHEAGNQREAEALLHGFNARYPDSIFTAREPELEAQTLLAMNDAAAAQRLLAVEGNSPAANRPGFQLAQAEATFSLGQAGEAQRLYKRLLLAHPLTTEAETARAKLTAMGAESSLTAAELRSLGDAYYNGGRYSQASEQYRSLARSTNLDPSARNGFAVAAAACDLKLKRLTSAEAEALADTPDDNGARRAYLLMELARNRNDLSEQQRIVASMESRFPHSSWLGEALYSSGNMYLLRRDYGSAAEYYSRLATQFPSGKYASAAHWKAAWLCYRQGLYSDAARLFDDQVKLYPSSKETAAALYWRGRLYESQDRQPALAAANYRAILRVYPHYFYGQMARQRLQAMGDLPAAHIPHLDSLQPPTTPPLEASFPADSPHLAKARLLANAGMNDYIAEEIAADPDSTSWSALAEAQIYAADGEAFRAMRALKRALPSAASSSIAAVPLAYWRILFPEPYWATIQSEAVKNHLDPYLVAAQIRQESEFNPAAVSKANALGLLQLLPAVGRSMAREEGLSGFQSYQLFDPETNIRLGTRYLRKTLDRFGGVTEYALAAYDAGDERVSEWQAAGPYSGMDEFVESIPFTETREYVEGILRNREMYRAIDEYARAQGK